MNVSLDIDPWSATRLALQAAFFLTLFLLVKQLFDLRDAARLKHLSRPKGAFRTPMTGLMALFGAVLLYQATWQLTGLYRPQFVAFMQSHDRREFNPAHWIQRGRLLDRRGEVLAESLEREGRVQRHYPDGPVFAPVVGYTHPRFGASGMEAVVSRQLDGGDPNSLKDLGELGRRILGGDKRPRGRDVVLTIDAELQRLAVERLGARRGAVVMLDPRDGAVRVLASVPAHDPNRIDAELFSGSDPATPLLNRATQGLYPPGSTFKIAVAALALERGFNGTLACPGDGFTTASHYRKIRDHEYYSARRTGHVWEGYGRLGLERALAVSSNVFFAQLGVLQGRDAFQELTERLGFNGQILLHQSTYGRFAMRTGHWPALAANDQYGLAQAAIGQGRLLVSPAYMALLTGALANQGVAVRPRLIATARPEVLARFMHPDVANRLAAMLRRVVTEGTARAIDIPELAIAGKTGTAENPQGDAHSWFVGFAPAERPALAVAVLVEHGGYGSATAAPIARDLLQRAHALGLMPSASKP